MATKPAARSPKQSLGNREREEAVRGRDLGQPINYSCTALKVSVGDNGLAGVFLIERGGASFGNGRWFRFGDTVRREMLATALAAITTNLRLEALLTSTDEFTTLSALAITRD